MRNLAIIGLLGLCGCDEAKDKEAPMGEDSAVVDEPTGDTGSPTGTDTSELDDPDTGYPPDPFPACETVDGGAGETVGTIVCDAGRCSVPAGAFWMGSDDDNACPVRSVHLGAFLIDQTEVTHGAWQDCVDAGVCETAPEHCHSEVADQEHDNQPVTCIDWQQAVDFCGWAEGRLPTEAEWEKAARGTDQAEWAWGAMAPSCLLANYRFTPSYCFPGVIEVGFFESSVSPYGLVDTVGNAWEWVSDWYDPRYYRVATDTDPQGPTCEDGDVYGNGACRARTIRGGAFNTTKETTRAHARSFANPAVADNDLGFRCAYDGLEE